MIFYTTQPRIIPNKSGLDGVVFLVDVKNIYEKIPYNKKLGFRAWKCGMWKISSIFVHWHYLI